MSRRYFVFYHSSPPPLFIIFLAVVSEMLHFLKHFSADIYNTKLIKCIYFFFFLGTNPCDLIKCGPGQECDIDQFGVASCQCPPSCEPKMQPVCGSNGHTFDNECELKRQSCLLRQELSVMHEGECGKYRYTFNYLIILNLEE